MGMYNWIEFSGRCPHCESTWLKVQCHVATSADGDENGRFAFGNYRIGERMRWWPANDTRWALWFESTDIALPQSMEALACCYGRCDSCDNNFYSVIRFRDRASELKLSGFDSGITPIEILDVGCDGDEPDTLTLLTMYEGALRRQ